MPNPYSYDFGQKVIEAIKLNFIEMPTVNEFYRFSDVTVEVESMPKTSNLGEFLRLKTPQTAN
ncbi:hypothetical protein [Nostoc sp. DSM 114167]|jgi:hypothetical protein|uniref:hypothetical protein n=1 Tax=Nostoc sp. DSM 114167 TaxID=3439050 RepID=UPI004046397D